MTEDWGELDALVEELRAGHEESWQRSGQLRQQMNALQPHLDVIAEQFEHLAVTSLLATLNERLLAGMGSLEHIESGMGFEHVAALVWPAQLDPRDRPDSIKDGYFRIEVWMGPAPQDGRARVRITGVKRLEATLPTNSERFRSALLTVFRDPQFIERPEVEGSGASPDDVEGSEDELTPQEEQRTVPEGSVSEQSEPDLMDS